MLDIKIEKGKHATDEKLRLGFAELEVIDTLNGFRYSCTLVATRRGLSFKVMSKKGLHEK
jgi:hypothetical protein